MLLCINACLCWMPKTDLQQHCDIVVKNKIFDRLIEELGNVKEKHKKTPETYN